MAEITTHTTYDVDGVLARLDADDPVLLELPGGGKLYLARAVPFLTVYRYGKQDHDYDLHADETAYCVLGWDEDPPVDFIDFLGNLLAELSDRFGGVMVLELWVNDEGTTPRMVVHAAPDHPSAVSETLIDHLKSVKGPDSPPTIELREDFRTRNTGPRPLLEEKDLKRRDILLLGMEINAFFLGEGGRPFPLVLRNFRDGLHTALRRAFFDFVRLETTYNASHFDQLGNHRVSDLVWEIDRKLVEISNSFPFLLLVTATNDDEAFDRFAETGYRTEPNFHYRFLPVDPEGVKRELFNLPIDRVKDATLAYTLRDKRDELFRMLDMLANRGNEHFRYGSMQVFGGVDDELLNIANSLLTVVPPPKKSDEEATLDAGEFLAACESEFAYLSEQYPVAKPSALIRDDLSGLMVSQGVLNIGHKLRVPRRRVEALIQHEIGTHVLTYWNGQAQPLTLLHSGTPGYEDLQEGLAVLGEWFVDGITPGRLRNLAARVVGIAYMLRGNSFPDTFALLHEHHGLSARTAFYTTARIFRGGGFTKDAVYLRGLVELLDYLRQGGDLEPLFVGKLRLDYVPLLDELTRRGILRPPPLIPRYFREDREAGHPKLNRLRAGMTVFDLIPR
ncbi:flavohemoglobin expression-modulating QEGLA motif protein [Lewinella sp. IMCC34191]|uniref:flavohemoglobin expression-modulating QEGLA motif protein n=1 Tax=Lewinella sp. IMCC34191 TaxID=2259172 RepID=UPI000E23D5E1|nr:tyrosine/phenylalanine carboxypeptidase domain-containing protein [Lewinella sp. IMCC34191]